MPHPPVPLAYGRIVMARDGRAPARIPDMPHHPETA
jgi:hypothetical protein